MPHGDRLTMKVLLVHNYYVRTAVRDGYGDLYTYVERVSGVSAPRLARFFAMGMLHNVVAAMGLHEEGEPEPWAARLMAGCTDPDAE